MSDLIDLAMIHAATAGAEDGRNAAGWWQQDNVGGRTTGDVAPVARHVLAGIEDGDPEVLDTLPGPDLSGQWADTPTERDIARGALAGVGLDLDGVEPEVITEIGDAYSLAYTTAVQDAVVEACQAVLV